MIFTRLAGFALDLLYPRRCRFCNQAIGFGTCKECDEAVSKLKRPVGTPIQRPGHNMDCLMYAFAPYHYDKPVSDAILRFKFSDKPLDEKALAADIANEVQNAENLPKFDLITFVPSTKNEMKEHGRNLPRILAVYLSQMLDIPLESGVLIKTRETKRQMGLSGEERRKNLKDAFAVAAPEKVQGKNVLIIDDVFTTGTTLNECAMAMRKSGAVCCCAATAAAAVR